jgi:hypothetical protein
MSNPPSPSPEDPAEGIVISDEEEAFLRDIVERAVVSAGDREPKHVTWLWNKRIPLKETTLLAGLAGQGKSQLICWLAAELTTGKMTGTPETVLCLNGEDPLDEVFVPRLIAAGANRDLVQTMKVGVDVTFPHDVKHLDLIVEVLKPKLVVVDPIMAFTDQDVDTHKVQDVRRLLKQFHELAARWNVAVITVMHFKKGDTSNVLHMISGSAGYGDACRSALVTGLNPRVEGQRPGEEQFVLMHAKNNYGRKQPALTYHVTEATFKFKDVDFETQMIVMDGEDPSITDEMFLARRGPDPEARQDAEAFLVSWLQGGPRDQSELMAGARTAGISVSTLKKAKKSLGLVSIPVRDKDTGHIESWQWAWYEEQEPKSDQPDRF